MPKSKLYDIAMSAFAKSGLQKRWKYQILTAAFGQKRTLGR
jgi:hypothetical protein